MTHRDFLESPNFTCEVANCDLSFPDANQLQLHSDLAHPVVSKEAQENIIPEIEEKNDSFVSSGKAIRGEKDRERRLEPCKKVGTYNM